MACFCMKIAGVVGQVSCLFDSTSFYFKSYLTEEKEDFSICISRDNLVFEQAELDAEAVAEGFRFRKFTDPFLERAAIQRAFGEFLFDRGVLLMHGSAVAVDGEGYLFTARSGTGKSTHTRLWCQLFGDRAGMINDDKPFIGLAGAEVMIYGSPWSGKHGLDSNVAVPLKGICFLERGVENCIHLADTQQVLPQLLKQGYCPVDAKKQEQYQNLVQQLAQRIPLWQMQCNKDLSAAKTAYEMMYHRGE